MRDYRIQRNQVVVDRAIASLAVMPLMMAEQYLLFLKALVAPPLLLQVVDGRFVVLRGAFSHIHF